VSMVSAIDLDHGLELGIHSNMRWKRDCKEMTEHHTTISRLENLNQFVAPCIDSQCSVCQILPQLTVASLEVLQQFIGSDRKSGNCDGSHGDYGNDLERARTIAAEYHNGYS
jgi:hypothetical protein